MNKFDLHVCVGGSGTVKQHREQITFIMRAIDSDRELDAQLIALPTWRGYFERVFAEINAGRATRTEWYLRLFRTLHNGSYDRLRAAGAQ